MAEQTAIAIFEDGVLRPIDPELLGLSEGQPVRLRVETLDRAEYILALFEQFYAGLSEEEITEIEKALRRRGPWFRPRTEEIDNSTNSTPIHIQLADYYQQQGIHPESFSCRHQDFCRGFAYQNDMTEAKMSLVGSKYGTLYPKIVVISLDPPSGNQGVFREAHQRTTAYMSAIHEPDNYTLDRPNPHWAITQIIVKDVLSIFGYRAQANAADIETSYAGRPIENVSAYFAHVNATKCSMNNPGQLQASHKVHFRCGNSYLEGELAILSPDILITQGKATNEIVGRLLMDQPILESDHPTQRLLSIGDRSVLWLPMRHPTRQLSKIRQDWPAYVQSIQEWKATRVQISSV